MAVGDVGESKGVAGPPAVLRFLSSRTGVLAVAGVAVTAVTAVSISSRPPAEPSSGHAGTVEGIEVRSRSVDKGGTPLAHSFGGRFDDIRRSSQSLLVLCTAMARIVRDPATASVSDTTARVLSSLSSDARTAEALAGAGGPRVTRWLLSQLRAPPGSGARADAESALQQILSHPGAASLLLSRRGVLRELLTHALASDYRNSEMASALRRAASGGARLEARFEEAEAVHLLGTMAGLNARWPQTAEVRHVCAWAIDCWTEREEDRQALRRLGAAPAIGKVLQDEAFVESATLAHLLRVVRQLIPAGDVAPAVEGREGEARKAREARAREIQALVQPIIHIGANAIANMDVELLSNALSCLAVIARMHDLRLLEMHAEVNSARVLLNHLRRVFASDKSAKGASDADVVAGTPGYKKAQSEARIRASADLKAALADLVAADAGESRTGGDCALTEPSQWLPLLVSWAIDSSKLVSASASPSPIVPRATSPAEAERAERLRASSVAALRLLVAEEGDVGMHAAQSWLAHLALAVGQHLEGKVTGQGRGGPTVELTRERIEDARQAAAALLDLPGAQLPPPGRLGATKGGSASPAVADEAASEAVLARAMTTLAALVSNDSFAQEWCLLSGLMDVLCKLVIPGPEEERAGSLALQEGAARLLAIVAMHDSFKHQVSSGRHEGPMSWLQARAASEYCRVSSHARRALLNSRARKDSSGERLALGDGLHLLVPSAPHHEELLTRPLQPPSASNAEGGPSTDPVKVDVVFIHGMRGGSFSTWRMQEFPPSPDMTHSQSWPAQWLAQDCPGARLLSIGYKTRVFDWEGASMSFRENSGSLLNRLAEAGVGQRPVVFVCHSMGGLMVKEMLMQGLAGREHVRPEAAAIAANTKGVVFYSTPHFGSWLARSSWNVFFANRGPLKDTVNVLRGGPYLESLNAFFLQFCKSNKVQVMSFSEASPTPLVQLGIMSLGAEVVPAESAYPGWGDFCMLEGVNHIYVCKPTSRQDPAYARTLKVVQEVAQARGGVEEASQGPQG